MRARAFTAAALLALLVPVAACDDDDDDAGSATSSSEAPATTSAAAASPADQAAVEKAWTTVFDSAVPVPDKLAFVAEPAVAEPVLTAYAAAGQQVGGISFAPKAVSVTGDDAEITYDVSFAGSPVYQDLEGALERSGDGFVVGTAQFCEVMSSARVPCP